jgi:4-carboxymuconolactone decarboxylase
MLDKPEGLSDAQLKVFHAISASRGAVKGPFSILLHNPELAARTAHLGSYIRFESHLSSQLYIVAALVTARLMNSEFEFSANAEHARDAGLSDAVIGAIRDRTAPEGLDEEQALVLRLGAELLTGKYRISAETYAAALNQFGRQGVVDLLATFGYYAYLACILNGFEVEPLPGHPPLP